MTDIILNPQAFWLVVYEARYTIVEITHEGDSFYAIGQDAIWDISCVTRWIREIHIPDSDSEEDTAKDWFCNKCGWSDSGIYTLDYAKTAHDGNNNMNSIKCPYNPIPYNKKYE